MMIHRTLKRYQHPKMRMMFTTMMMWLACRPHHRTALDPSHDSQEPGSESSTLSSSNPSMRVSLLSSTAVASRLPEFTNMSPSLSPPSSFTTPSFPPVAQVTQAPSASMEVSTSVLPQVTVFFVYKEIE
ncbi:hypothetical protein F442_07500 [Phytophthora nicotianae P10297]|uniref:Uncharacterized protein n=2 Tax=Phytophthora nicotianae TaxID=4792 RepID=W2ZGQ9_PHYNI|nr:hypothetical protein L917_07148 [Phytophthora nicotianae]ETP46215.1 hypothetical protein F442_07500 [Phytophthora nicotianae P10297]